MATRASSFASSTPPTPRIPAASKPGGTPAKAAPARKPAPAKAAPATRTPASASVRRDWSWLRYVLMALVIVASLVALAVALEECAPTVPGPVGPKGDVCPVGPQGEPGIPGTNAVADNRKPSIDATAVQTDTLKAEPAVAKGPTEISTDDVIEGLKIKGAVMTVKIPAKHGFVATIDPATITWKAQETSFTSGVMVVIYNDGEEEQELKVYTSYWCQPSLRNCIHGTLYRGTYDEVVAIGRDWNSRELKPIFWVSPVVNAK